MTNDVRHRAMHDLGGVEPEASQSIDRHEHALTQFDKSVDALMNLLCHPDRRVMRVDELRRTIESLPPEQYTGLSYYELWIQAIHNLMVEKGVFTAADVARKLAAIKTEDSRA